MTVTDTLQQNKFILDYLLYHLCGIKNSVTKNLEHPNKICNGKVGK